MCGKTRIEELPEQNDVIQEEEQRPQFGNRTLNNEADVYSHNAWRLCHIYTDWEYTRHRKKPAGGVRKLTNQRNAYKFNAWDNVKWNAEQERLAAEAVARNSAEKMSAENCQKFQENADSFWDSFYNTHQTRFFKDRHWLLTEFPEVAPLDSDMPEPTSIFELGCGVGNTILPILKFNRNENLRVYGCDFSTHAINLFREHSQYEAERCQLWVMDCTLENWSQIVPFEENSLDIIMMIFVLSAIEPAHMQSIVQNCYRYLRPGGLVVFRDYGRYDLAQLRFKSGKCLNDNQYVRGDGTMVYFFTLEEITALFSKVGFETAQAIVDRRLQVNRSRFLKMYRVWIQAKFRKPLNS